MADKKLTPNEAAMEVVNTYTGGKCDTDTAEAELESSYTGVTCDGEAPQQDADDL